MLTHSVERMQAAAKWMLRNCIISRDSLTPELRLRLITEASPLWMSTPEQCPLPDPYWAFYWPGGQALTRYIYERPVEFSGAHVIDFGCGCGSASIAAASHKATIIANDIDRNALLATTLNFRLNGVSDEKVEYWDTNLLLPGNEHLSREFLMKGEKNRYLLLGDMFYDSDFAAVVFSWLKRLSGEVAGLKILAGDPDRHPLADERYTDKYEVFKKEVIEEYVLPAYVIREHYGFNTAKIIQLKF